MKKKFWISLGVLVVIVLGVFAFSPGPPEETARAGITGNVIAGENVDAVFSGEKVSIDLEKSEVSFEGFKPGGSHPGVFEEWSGMFYVEDGVITGFEGVIEVSSVKTDSEGVDKHLQNEDFFDVANYPTIEFSGMIENGEASGPLTFHGVTHEISFPVEVGEGSVKADFVLDTTPFNFKYVGVNKEVVIGFDFFS